MRKVQMGRAPTVGMRAFVALNGAAPLASQTAATSPPRDSMPPLIEWASPASEVTQEIGPYKLVARVTDSGTGIDGTWCNGLRAQVVDAVLECTVALSPGRNATAKDFL